VKSIKKLFYTSFLGNIYFNILLWYDNFIERRQRRKNLPNFTTKQIIKQTNQMYYDIGIKQIKTKINTLTKTATKEEYERVLSELKELLSLAALAPEDKQELSDILYKVAVKKGKDINNDIELAKMVNTRISHFNELQQHKIKRELNKRIRIAYKAGDVNLANDLIQEFKSKYGRSR